MASAAVQGPSTAVLGKQRVRGRSVTCGPEMRLPSVDVWMDKASYDRRSSVLRRAVGYSPHAEVETV